ncbi:hypothetical protein [Mucilaginibacter lacusdianchii]|uniref:hypothetical protein n=1 Tax=Mucilaginibacter lacusdianchii TaxID=2684211 RepID=UPI00131B4435|nr:hypothetical protein [Mucilaginibacter sp. JXJ CY 39]
MHCLNSHEAYNCLSKIIYGDIAATNISYGNKFEIIVLNPSLGWLVDELNKERTAAGGQDQLLGVSLLFEYSDLQGPGFTLVYGQTFMQWYGAKLNAIDSTKPMLRHRAYEYVN